MSAPWMKPFLDADDKSDLGSDSDGDNPYDSDYMKDWAEKQAGRKADPYSDIQSNDRLQRMNREGQKATQDAMDQYTADKKRIGQEERMEEIDETAEHEVSPEDLAAERKLQELSREGSNRAEQSKNQYRAKQQNANQPEKIEEIDELAESGSEAGDVAEPAGEVAVAAGEGEEAGAGVADSAPETIVVVEELSEAAEGTVASGEGAVAGGAAAGASEAALGATEAVGEAGMAGAEMGAIGAGVGIGEVLGAGAVGLGAVAVLATVVVGVLCITNVLPVCKKRVCVDPRGRWHSHKSHCEEQNGCYDLNGQWHRNHKHCVNKVCQGPDGWWHHKKKHCKYYGCHDPNGDWHRHLEHCLRSKFKCQGPGGRYHKKMKDCHASKRDLAIAERDAAFANADTLSVDNSYIVITNAEKFAQADLDVLKGMVIFPDDDWDHASFERDTSLYAEGEVSMVQPSPDVWAGNFSFPFLNKPDPVVGKLLTIDPRSSDPKAVQLRKEIQERHKKAGIV